MRVKIGSLEIFVDSLEELDQLVQRYGQQSPQTALQTPPRTSAAPTPPGVHGMPPGVNLTPPQGVHGNNLGLPLPDGVTKLPQTVCGVRQYPGGQACFLAKGHHGLHENLDDEKYPTPEKQDYRSVAVPLESTV